MVVLQGSGVVDNLSKGVTLRELDHHLPEMFAVHKKAFKLTTNVARDRTCVEDWNITFDTTNSIVRL